MTSNFIFVLMNPQLSKPKTFKFLSFSVNSILQLKPGYIASNDFLKSPSLEHTEAKIHCFAPAPEDLRESNFTHHKIAGAKTHVQFPKLTNPSPYCFP